MSQGTTLPWRRTRAERERLATGSLVFDQHRHVATQEHEEEIAPEPPKRRKR